MFCIVACKLFAGFAYAVMSPLQIDGDVPRLCYWLQKPLLDISFVAGALHTLMIGV